jgi:hypothetical protein
MSELQDLVVYTLHRDDNEGSKEKEEKLCHGHVNLGLDRFVVYALGGEW